MKRSNRFAVLVAAVVVGLVGVGVVWVSGTGPVGVNQMTAELWREDLAYLAEKLEAKHGNLYNQVSQTDFEAAVTRLDQRIPDLKNHEVAAEMGRIVALVGDGHTELWLRQSATGFQRFPIALSYFGDDLHVFAAALGNEDLVGLEVLAIDGVQIDEVYARIIPLIAHDNEFEYLRSAPLYMTIPEVLQAVGVIDNLDRAVFTFDDGDREVAAVPSLVGATWTTAVDLSGAEIPLASRKQEAYYWYEYLEDERTLFVKYNRCRNDPDGQSVKQFANELFEFADGHDVARMVIDLRDNTGGNFHRNRPLIEGVLERPEINQKGRFFVLTSRTTFSAATIAAIDFKRETNALIVGEPSRGRPNGYSDEKHLRLPNSGLEVNYSPIYREAMPELGDAPFLPVDLAVDETFADYRDGRDPVLETVLRWTPEGVGSATRQGHEQSARSALGG